MATLTPVQALTDLLAYLKANQVGDMHSLPGVRSEEFAGYIERAQAALSAAPMKASPFAVHREAILGEYGTAQWLQKLVMHLWNSTDYAVPLNRIGGFDAKHRTIALELIEHYARNGENDREFMSLADVILARVNEKE